MRRYYCLMLIVIFLPVLGCTYKWGPSAGLLEPKYICDKSIGKTCWLAKADMSSIIKNKYSSMFDPLPLTENAATVDIARLIRKAQYFQNVNIFPGQVLEGLIAKG